MLTAEDLADIESRIKWGLEIDHGETLKFAEKLMALFTEHREYASKLDEAQKIIARSCFCDFEDGTECQGHQKIREERDDLVALTREIVAWFDVIAQKYEGNTIVTSEWPNDWLRRAKEPQDG